MKKEGSIDCLFLVSFHSVPQITITIIIMVIVLVVFIIIII